MTAYAFIRHRPARSFRTYRRDLRRGGHGVLRRRPRRGWRQLVPLGDEEGGGECEGDAEPQEDHVPRASSLTDEIADPPRRRAADDGPDRSRAVYEARCRRGGLLRAKVDHG